MNLEPIELLWLRPTDGLKVILPVRDFANFYMFSAAGIVDIVAVKDSTNLSVEALPPIVPHLFAALEHSGFCFIIHIHPERLLAARLGPSNIHSMKQEYLGLVRAVGEEATMRAAISPRNNDESLYVCWSIVNGRLEPFWLGLHRCF